MTLRLVKGHYPGSSFDDLIACVVEHNVMLGKSHKVYARGPRRIALVCSAGKHACDFRAVANSLKTKMNMGGVEGIRITQFSHHTCTVGCQRSRQMTSKVLTNVVSTLQDYVPEKGPGGAAKQMQDTVKRASGIDIGRGQAHILIKMRRDEIKNTTNRDTPLSQKERVEAATNELLERFYAQLSKKDDEGRLAIMTNTGKRKKAAKAAAELFFRIAKGDLAEVENAVGSNNMAGSNVCGNNLDASATVGNNIGSNVGASSIVANEMTTNPEASNIPINSVQTGNINMAPNNVVAGNINEATNNVMAGNINMASSSVAANGISSNTIPSNVDASSFAGNNVTIPTINVTAPVIQNQYYAGNGVANNGQPSSLAGSVSNIAGCNAAVNSMTENNIMANGNLGGNSMAGSSLVGNSMTGSNLVGNNMAGNSLADIIPGNEADNAVIDDVQ